MIPQVGSYNRLHHKARHNRPRWSNAHAIPGKLPYNGFMPDQVTMLGLFRLPAPLGVTAGCFGKRFNVKIGSFAGSAILPCVVWADIGPNVTAPSVKSVDQKYIERYAKTATEGESDCHFWGNASEWHARKNVLMSAHIGAIVLDFKVARGAIAYSGQIDGRMRPMSAEITNLFHEIDEWFDRVRTWVEVAVDQDADPLNPLPNVWVRGYGLQVFTVDGETVSLPESNRTIQVLRNSYDPINLPTLRKSFKYANSGDAPSDAHLLLRDSKAQCRRGHFRRAVIDAGPAVEITLSDFNRRVTHVNVGNGQPLGWYVGQSKIAARAKLPTNTKKDLVELRNKAIHENVMPSHNEAILALELAQKIVNSIDPLP
jgi:hypothetical protein